MLLTYGENSLLRPLPLGRLRALAGQKLGELRSTHSLHIVLCVQYLVCGKPNLLTIDITSSNRFLAASHATQWLNIYYVFISGSNLIAL